MIFMNMRRRAWVLGCVALLCATTSGCALVSQLQYAIHGYKTEAKFKGLEGKKVAVVCFSESSGPSNEASVIASQIGTILGANVKKMTVIPQAKVADWIDRNDSDQTDFLDVGRGVKADMVIGIDLASFSIHEGQTLLKGRAETTIRVYDMKKNGEMVYGPTTKNSIFPVNAARHATENENEFRRYFLYNVAQDIARDFYAYDRMEDYAQDTAFSSN